MNCMQATWWRHSGGLNPKDISQRPDVECTQVCCTYHEVDVAVVVDEVLHQLLKAVLFSGDLPEIMRNLLSPSVKFLWVFFGKSD